MKQIMATLKMVPKRYMPLWSVEAPRNRSVGILQDDLVEVYSPERIVLCAQRVGLRPELPIDLLTGGTCWTQR